jgi:hypothetical protein
MTPYDLQQIVSVVHKNELSRASDPNAKSKSGAEELSGNQDGSPDGIW